jgi:RNA polymerase sigma-70 factor (ECF subfamily)
MANSTSPSDEQLLHLMMNGDEEAFVVLYQRRQGGVYRFALHMSGSETTAEDVTQEVFLALLRSAGNFDPGKGALVSFLYGIARNQVLRRLERDRPFLSLADRESDEVEVMAQDYTTRDPLNDLTRTELIEGVRQAILTLPQHYREVVVLCELHELSYSETAEVLGCAIGTVRSRLHRARALLVDRLRPRDEINTGTLNAGVMRSLV